MRGKKGKIVLQLVQWFKVFGVRGWKNRTCQEKYNNKYL